MLSFQLVRQISQKKVFLDYLEGKITFKPTYKYDPGTDTFDTRLALFYFIPKFKTCEQ